MASPGPRSTGCCAASGVLDGRPREFGGEDPEILREEQENAQKLAASERAFRSLLAF